MWIRWKGTLTEWQMCCKCFVLCVDLLYFTGLSGCCLFVAVVYCFNGTVFWNNLSNASYKDKCNVDTKNCNPFFTPRSLVTFGHQSWKQGPQTLGQLGFPTIDVTNALNIIFKTQQCSFCMSSHIAFPTIPTGIGMSHVLWWSASGIWSFSLL